MPRFCFSALIFPDYFAIGIGVVQKKKTRRPATASYKIFSYGATASRRCFSVILFWTGQVQSVLPGDKLTGEASMHFDGREQKSRVEHGAVCGSLGSALYRYRGGGRRIKSG